MSVLSVRSWPLRKQLVVGVCAVVMAVLIVVGTMSVLTLRASVTGIVDTQLLPRPTGTAECVTKYRALRCRRAHPEPTAMKPLIYLIGQAPGNIVVLIQNGIVVDSAMFGDGDAAPPPPTTWRRSPRGRAPSGRPRRCGCRTWTST